jgi:hypothetical protein
MTRDPIDFARPQEIAAEVPSDLLRADFLLRQYGIWASTGRRNVAPGTLDRMYRRESDGRESREAYRERCAEVPRDPIMTTPDALAVHRALVRVADDERMVLQILYVPQRVAPQHQLRILRIPPLVSRERHLGGLRQFDNLHRIGGRMRAT